MRYQIFGSLALIFASALMGTEGAQAQRLSATAEFTINHETRGKPLPKWLNGFVVVYDHDVTPAPILLFDSAGKLVSRSELSLSKGGSIRIRDVGVSPSGRIAICGTAIDGTGRGATFIAWMGPTGAIEFVVRPSEFSAERVAFAADGNLWALGKRLPPPGSPRFVEPPHDILRQYSVYGELMQSALPRASFVTRTPVYHPSERSFLTGSGDRIGVLSNPAGEWVELSLSEGVISRWALPMADQQTEVTGVALTDSNAVYLSVKRSDGRGKAASAFYKLDRALRRWVEVEGAHLLTTKGSLARLFGSAGEDLVISNALPTFLRVRIH